MSNYGEKSAIELVKKANILRSRLPSLQDVKDFDDKLILEFSRRISSEPLIFDNSSKTLCSNSDSANLGDAIKLNWKNWIEYTESVRDDILITTGKYPGAAWVNQLNGELVRIDRLLFSGYADTQPMARKLILEVGEKACRLDCYPLDTYFEVVASGDTRFKCGDIFCFNCFYCMWGGFVYYRSGDSSVGSKIDNLPALYVKAVK